MLPDRCLKWKQVASKSRLQREIKYFLLFVVDINAWSACGSVLRTLCYFVPYKWYLPSLQRQPCQEKCYITNKDFEHALKQKTPPQKTTIIKLFKIIILTATLMSEMYWSFCTYTDGKHMRTVYNIDSNCSGSINWFLSYCLWFFRSLFFCRLHKAKRLLNLPATSDQRGGKPWNKQVLNLTAVGVS